MEDKKEKAREDRVRSQAKRQGFIVRKDRVRIWNINHHGGFMIVNDRNIIEAGQNFDLTIDEVENFLIE